jgi:hypothetical protein
VFEQLRAKKMQSRMSWHKNIAPCRIRPASDNNATQSAAAAGATAKEIVGHRKAFWQVGTSGSVEVVN